MKKAAIALSWVLILSSLFGLVSAVRALKNTYEQKDRWEAMILDGTDRLAALDESLSPLEEQEAEYLDTREQVAKAVRALPGKRSALEERSAALEESKEAYEKDAAELAARKDALESAEYVSRTKQAQLDADLAELEIQAEAIQAEEEALKALAQEIADDQQLIADGQALMARYEADRDEAIGRLEQQLQAEPEGALVSVRDRLEPEFSYMKNKTDLDLAQARALETAAGEYTAELTATVSREISTRVTGAVLTILGSAAALVGGAVSTKKPGKLDRILSLVGTVSAAAGVIVSFTSRSPLSDPGLDPMSIAGLVVAVSSLAKTVSSFVAARKEKAKAKA